VDQSQQVYDLFIVLKKAVHFSGYNVWGKAGRPLPMDSGRPTHLTPPERHVFSSQWRTMPMSDHQLKFKGPGFDFDAKGLWGLVAAIVIVVLVLLVPRLLY
jgi:hypothetical protein